MPRPRAVARGEVEHRNVGLPRPPQFPDAGFHGTKIQRIGGIVIRRPAARPGSLLQFLTVQIKIVQ